MNRFFILLVFLSFGSSAIGQSQDSLKMGDTLSGNGNKVLEFHEVTSMAVFPGGDAAMYAYIGSNLNYPQLAFENGIQGKVIVQFVVQPDGSITDVQTLGSNKLGYGLEEEAIRVVKSMPRWQPAIHRNKAVPVRFRLPINYEIGEDTPRKKKFRKSKDTPREEPKKSDPTSLPTNKPQNPNPYD